MTYGGTPMTQSGFQDGTTNRVEIWYLLDPPVGTSNVVATLTAAANTVGGAASFAGVAGAPTGFSSFAGTGTTASIPGILGPLTSNTLVIDTLAAQGLADPAIPDLDQTERWSDRTGGGSGNVLGAGSTQPGELLLPDDSWTLAASSPWALAAVTLNPC